MQHKSQLLIFNELHIKLTVLFYFNKLNKIIYL